jgi:hypothetical protein
LSSRSARSSASRSIRPARSLVNVLTVLPVPSMASALSALAWTKPPAMTGIAGSPAIPSAAMSTPCWRPHHCRAAPSAVKLAMVAPVVRTPLQEAGRCRRSLSHDSASCSKRAPRGELTHRPALLSSADANQSAASAAGVEPPVTKWKKRGPADRVAASGPSSVSSANAARLPSPSSGSVPPKCAAASSERGLRAGSSSSRSM